MKRLVCCQAVPDLEDLSVSQSQGRVFEKGRRKLHPADERAVEAALRARQPGDEVIALTVGQEADADALRKPLAMGADRAVLVILEHDGFVLANAIRAAARQLGCEAIHFGEPFPRVGGIVGGPDPRTVNAMAIMKSAKKPIERLAPELPEDDRRPRVALRSECLA